MEDALENTILLNCFYEPLFSPLLFSHLSLCLCLCLSVSDMFVPLVLLWLQESLLKGMGMVKSLLNNSAFSVINIL
jgi:hypothetical protein